MDVIWHDHPRMQLVKVAVCPADLIADEVRDLRKPQPKRPNPILFEPFVQQGKRLRRELRGEGVIPWNTACQAERNEQRLRLRVPVWKQSTVEHKN